MPPGTRFDWHTHEDHQLAWAASGVLTVLTADATWVLPPTRALWIPAGLPHETAPRRRPRHHALAVHQARRGRHAVRPLAHPAAAAGRAVHARGGRAGQPGGRPVGYDTPSAFVAAFR